MFFRRALPLALISMVVASSLAYLFPAAASVLPEGTAGPDAVLLFPGPREKDAAADSILASMAGSVNADSIHAFLGALTGEVPAEVGYGERTIRTRLSGSNGCEHAADFLARVFEAHGYETEYQFFRYDKSFQTILVRPDGFGLLAGEDGYVLRAEGGGPWARTKAGIDTIGAVLRDISPVGTGRYVLVGNAGTILATDDAGDTWAPRPSSTAERLEAVSILPSGTGWTAGRAGTILKTADGGSTWATETSGVTVFLRDVAALDAATAVVVGDAATILRTTDGGSNWSPVATGTTQNLNGVSFVGSSGWAVGAAGRILATVNGGASWTPQTSGVTTDLRAVSFSDASNGWAVGDAGAILRTTNGGASWSPQTGPWPTVAYRAVSAVSSLEGWTAGMGATLARTTDGGSTWADRIATVEAGWLNVEATKTGTAAPSEEVLLVGHFDSISQISTESAPGADDNGSGIAVIAEAARILADRSFEKTIRFVCFAGEEQGLYGSAAYAARADATGANIVGVLNLDSVGWNDDYFRLFSNDDSAWLGDLAASMAAEYAPGLPTYHWYCPTCTWSDHASFWTHGFDAIVGIETWDPAPPQHHTTADTLGLMDMPLVADVARISLTTIASMAVLDTTTETGVASDGDIPESAVGAFALLLATPNPFNPSTEIRFDLPREDFVSIEVFSSAGRLVRTLVEGRLAAGRHGATWDGRDDAGRAAASGVYFCRIESGRFRDAARLVLVR